MNEGYREINDDLLEEVHRLKQKIFSLETDIEETRMIKDSTRDELVEVME